MAKSAIHKLLTEILHGIEKLIYTRFIDKHYIKNILLNSFPSAMHSMPNFAVLERESRHESSAKQQQAAMFVSDIRKKTCSFNSFSASVSTLNHHIFTYFVQRRSFLSSSYHLNLKKAFKVKNLVHMTMHHGRCHWSRLFIKS